ncbi:MAG TPA: ATP-binding protein [Bryobacteraceae bacterium]|nr:ATP-binding protein [Bryobacteraceae bacterium]
MTFRTRLLLIVSLILVAAVVLVESLVSESTRHAFDRLEDQRIQALVAQFRSEFARQGQEIVRRVKAIADADSTLNIAINLNQPQPDYASYVAEAPTLAAAHNLDFLELVSGDGTIISSAQWPARFGYKQEWVLQPVDWNAQGAFLKREELQEEVALALVCVRVVAAGERKLYLIGGEKLDRDFLASLVLPAGLRVLLYRNLGPGLSPQSITDPGGGLRDVARLAPLIQAVRAGSREGVLTVRWSRDAASAETFHAIPLSGRENNLLGALLVGSSRREQVEMERFLRTIGFLVAGGGILLGVVISWWATARVTRPVRALAAGAREVAGGNWSARVDVRSGDEIGALAEAFNQMTRQLAEQRDRLIQSERVAAWRELARRLAHELKNPLFPLQITVENLQRARDQHPEQFDEVFRESTATLLAELANLRRIIGRFSDFARMPPPELQPVDLNQLMESTRKLFEAQLQASPVRLHLDLAPALPTIQADPDQISRALQNLVLNAIDAMPQGGDLTIRTRARDGAVELEVSDTGQGLTPEECQRLFTPYYTSKAHGTGLGLAIVQSVVSDHKGRISVDSEPGKGTTFRIELR